ncbi:MAG: mannonate dehydratase [Candidatus Latescibacterota bacterium]|nr:mannonate dehydratase [Candidatus Latescibacterota bacterium]
MYIGTQGRFNDDTQLEVLAQLGVNNVDHTPSEPWTDWSTEMIVALRERFDKFGVNLEMMHIPLRGRPAIKDSGREGQPNSAGVIFMGESDERNRQIDQACEVIRMAGQAGLRGLNYNITILGHLRTPAKTGRGGATLSTFDFEKLPQDIEDFTGAAGEDEMWERIEYWLKRVIPVAEEYRVQMACHPSDPGIGNGKMYRGVARPLGMPDGFKKFIDLVDSPYNGLNFCQGCMSEALENPSEEIFDVIRYFGERKKIFNVHFRNIKGGLNNFVEVLPDDGDIDMIKALRVYKEVGYEYMIMPDHVPRLSGEAAREVGFAYTYGYIHAAMQAVNG